MSSLVRANSNTAGWLVLAILIASAANGRNLRARSGGFVDTEIDDFVPYRGERHNSFDWNLFQNLLKSNKGNVLVSPTSLKLALALLYEGSQDQTALELEKVMNLPASRSATREQFSNVLKSLQEQKADYKLNIGSRIYMDSSILPRQRYTAIAESFYNTNILSTNFSDPHESAEMINNFVKNLTSGRISKIVDDEGSLQDSMMVMVNALFFKGTWYRQPFNPNDTRTDKFFTSDNKIVQVPFMRANTKFYIVYAEDLDAKILRLPYAGHKYSMYIVLPQGHQKVEDVLKKINPAVINKQLWLMQELPADVMIPKFKFDFTSHLSDDLRELGIKDIFKDSATLTGILRSKTTTRRLVVSDIVQKAGIEVGEKGTVAFTASEIEIGNKMNDETFHATRPFAFYIEDEHSGAILYMGVVNDPLEETALEPAPTRIGEDDSADQQPEEPTSADYAVGLGFSDRQNFFNIELLQSLNNASPGNVIVGTSSLKSALMVLAEAAAGQTRDQIVSVLRLPSDPKDIRKVATDTLTPSKEAGTEVQQAVKLWLALDVPLTKNFNEVLHEVYNGSIECLDFSETRNAIKTINDWASKYTKGRINSIVDSSNLARDTRMLLTTAVYFKGTWQHAFDKTATRIRCFNVQGSGCYHLPLMENVGLYKYAEVPALDAQLVQIPYTGGRVSLVVLLPNCEGEQALKELSRDLTFTPVSTLLAALKEQEILLQMPKFSIRSQTDLRSRLRELGIRELFEDRANLSAGFPRGNVKVGGVIHNAQIDVNEEGTIASAVTGVSVIPLIGSTATTFRADRPFVFFILDNVTNGILFAGRYVRPDQPMAAPETVRNSYVNNPKYKTG